MEAGSGRAPLSPSFFRAFVLSCFRVSSQASEGALPYGGREVGRDADDDGRRARMSEATRQRLTRLAEQSSTGGRKVSPMQSTAQILEDALSGIPER